MHRFTRGTRFQFPNATSDVAPRATDLRRRLNHLERRRSLADGTGPRTEIASAGPRRDASPHRLADESVVCFATAAGFLLTAAICWLNDGALLPRAAVHAMSFAGCFYLYLGAVGLVSQSIREITARKVGSPRDAAPSANRID